MDLFATVLITITIVTICGICLFIFICGLQPQILYSLQRRKHRTYYITSARKPSEIDSDPRLNNRNSIPTTRPLVTSNYSDQRVYLKVIERSLRTGKRIEDEKENHSLRQCMDRHLSQTTNTKIRNTEI